MQNPGCFRRSRFWPVSCYVRGYPHAASTRSPHCAGLIFDAKLDPPSELRVFFVLRTAIRTRPQRYRPEPDSRCIGQHKGEYAAVADVLAAPTLLPPALHHQTFTPPPTAAAQPGRVRGIPLCRAPHRNDRAPTAAPAIPPARQRPASDKPSRPRGWADVYPRSRRTSRG